MGKIADSVIINIIKVSFEWIQVTRNRWSSQRPLYHSPDPRKKTTGYNYWPAVQYSKAALSGWCHKRISLKVKHFLTQWRTSFIAKLSSIHPSLSLSLSFLRAAEWFSEGNCSGNHSDKDLPVDLWYKFSYLWLIMAGCWEQVRVHLRRQLGKPWTKRWRSRTAV